MSVIEREPFQVESPTAPYRVWTPFDVFEASPTTKAALVILNTNMTKVPLRRLWNNSVVQVCADGGANRLYEYFKTDEERSRYIPKYITGDCDLVRPEVVEYYVAKGTIMIEQTSQYSTDFMKSLKVALLHCGGASELLAGPIEQCNGLTELMLNVSPSLDLSVYVAGGIGGRFDQSFQLINQLYVLTQEYPQLAMYFFTSSDVIFLLRSGCNHVKYSSPRIFNTKEDIPKCGLLPFGRSPILDTCGLQYDVANWPSEVGGAVSSSNGIVGIDGFTVCTSDDIVMNIEVDLEKREV